jgi:hypothetical protein
VSFLCEKFLDEAEGLFNEGKFKQALGLLAECDSANYCDGAALHPRHLRLLTNLASSLIATSAISDLHRFYRGRIANWERQVLKGLAGSPIDKIWAEESAYPYLLDWCRRYIRFCEQVGDAAKLDHGKAELERLSKKNFSAPKKYPKDKRPVTEEVFWDLIKEAKLASAEGPSDIGEDLVARLLSRKQADILHWDKLLYEKVLVLYSDRTWELGHKHTGFMSDDGTLYFCGWIIGEGKEFYKSFRKDPEAALSAVASGSSLQCEEILLVANMVFEAKEWDEEKLEKLRLKLPELEAKFASLE